MKTFPRRAFNEGLLKSLFTFSLVETLANHRALAVPLQPIAERWVAEVEEISRGMKEQRVKQREWQQKIEDFFTRVELKDFLRGIDFERLSKTMKFPDDHEGVTQITPHGAGQPAELSYSAFVYGLSQGRAIVPHCHRNMTSLHMVIAGELHGWHFDRVADEPGHLIIKPTLDKQLALGEVSTTSDVKDNVHWFKATSETAFTFNIGVYEINSTVKFSGRQFYLDAAGGEKLRDGLLRVRHLKTQEAHKLYGKS
jgi:hypothetical protein